MFIQLNKILRIAFAVLICHVSSIGQNIIVLKKSNKRHKIKTQQLLGITLKGEPYKFDGWKNLNKQDKEVQENFWVVDSIGLNSIKLVTYKYTVTYKLDTVSGKKKVINHGNEYVLQEVIKSQVGKDGYYKVAYKIPTVEVLIDKSKVIPLDSIESFTDLKVSFEKNISPISRIHFNYPFSTNSAGVKNTAIVLMILTVVSGTIIETTFNTSVAITEKLARKKEFLTRRYKTGEWKIEVR